MNNKKIWPSVTFAIGIVIGVFGAFLVAAYFTEAVIARIGDPDQSLLFWYLPFLFFGIIGLISGFTMAAGAFIRLKKIK